MASTSTKIEESGLNDFPIASLSPAYSFFFTQLFPVSSLVVESWRWLGLPAVSLPPGRLQLYTQHRCAHLCNHPN